MTSVFNVGFRDNLRRIQGEESGGRRRAEEATKEFSKVLGDIERERLMPEKSASNAPTNGAVQQSNVPPPTREEKGEIEYLTSENNPFFRFVSHTAVPQQCELNECQLDVKALLGDVKSPTRLLTGLDDDLAVDAEIPAPPVIKSMERIQMSVPKSATNPMTYERDELENIINTAGKYHGVDPTLSLAVAHAESSLRIDAVSKDGFASKGMFQLLDSTAKDLMGRFDMKDAYDPFDPGMNAFLGVGYLRRLHDLFSSETNLGGKLMTVPVKSADDLEKVALAAFNAGEGNVAKAQRLASRLGKDPALYTSIEPYLPPSTRTYVQRVTNYKVEFARAKGGNDIA
ncbi:MAG: transglycosylase SLT domain-containing protein [Deltaproteobacteria bacterium]|nr:transglycosylase SLT domain-containing protein [Deltaproteobacteria bacterium]